MGSLGSLGLIFIIAMVAMHLFTGRGHGHGESHRDPENRPWRPDNEDDSRPSSARRP
ncbi:MAG: DUF2933 domain-containing protein [Peptococcaceae bacterium]|jgi:hypothetical protein|nr:DUF2933 domain-containing protein [Peptococcaceae bacterium]